MSRLSRWTAALLAVCILINLIPVPSFAQTEETVTEETVLSASDETTAYLEETVATILETAPTEEVTQPTEEITVPTEEETQATEEETVPTEEETQATEEVTVPTEDETVPTEDETVPTEEETLPVETDELLLSTLEIDDEPATYIDFSAKYFAQILREKLYLEADIKKIITEADGKVTLTIGKDQADILVLLSNTQQGPAQSEEEPSLVFNYSQWIIAFPGITGTLTLPDDFSGLGDTNYPFAGTLSGQSITFSTENTLFKALDSGADLGGKSIAWTGTADKAILAETLYVDSYARSINMPLTSATAFSPYIGQLMRKDGVTAPGEITLPALNYTPGSAVTAETPKFPDAAGLLCGTMAAGTKLKFDSTLTLPNIPVSISATEDVGTLVGRMESGAQLTFSAETTLVTSLSGANAGGLVGSMAAGAKLIIESPLTLTNTLTGSNNAGGLAGALAAEATIQVDANVTITKAGTDAEPIYNTITATKSAGGIVGEMTTTNGSVLVSDDCTISLTDTESKVTGGENAGGLYGSCIASGDLDPLNGVSITQVKLNGYVAGQRTNLGGLFGTLTLSGTDNQCVCSFNNAPLAVTLISVTGDTYLGGIVGTLNGSTPSNRKNALIVNQPNIQISNSDLTPRYLGGIVAWQNATVDVTGTEDSNTVSFNYPHTAGSDKTDLKHNMGGLSAYVCDGMLLVADTVKISNTNSNYPATDQNGGIAGSVNKGSIVYLLNNTDLSSCPLTSTAASGMLVATQNCSLVYSSGTAITRYNKSGMELDDIGNYGELYRLPDFVTLNRTTYATTLPELSLTENACTFNNATDYACFALAWQSRGHFPTVSGITTAPDSWRNLKTATITLGADIDLSNGGNGYGIGGLSRDVYSADDTFSGKLYGAVNGSASHTITLGIGNRYCATSNIQSITSDGRIYFHNSPGLFAGLSSQATVKNLTLTGSIRLSNNRLAVSPADQTAYMKTGALAGLFLCEGDSSGTITNVSTTVSIDAKSGTQTSDAPFYIGGLFGLAYGNVGTTLTLDANLGAAITHTLSGATLVGHRFHIGGAIGAVDEGCTNLKIQCNGAVISGEINRVGSAENYYVGGLVGTIFPSGSSSRTITLTNLKVGQKVVGEIPAKSFTLSGNAEKRMGGVLGGIWADTDVTISGLTVENATLTASGEAKLGGLVYRASGKWEVSSADLSGLTITASSAEGLGLMVCQGGPYREPLGYAASGSDTYKEIGGLYLVMTENWAWKNNKGYNVPTNITFGGDVFDEFVAYTANAYYTEGNKDTPPYSITSNGSGIISLKTNNGIVNMTGKASDRNTYENRTAVAKKTNLYSRYYYNLPGKSIQGDIDAPEELLIWSVYHYAAPNLRKNFQVDKENKFEIGGAPSGGRADFDMVGLSYYPIRITDSSITVQYADVTFYNKQIENQVSDEKSTRFGSSDHTQHYTMHCGLFLDFAAENIKASAAHTMTINGVTFAGTVGKVNGHSGALICGSVYGDNENSNIATCTVVLADSDHATKAVTLNGISVDSTEDYRPVLIGHMDSYSGLKANYVTVSDKQNTVAGSSLIGDVGHSAATGLAITFAGTIKLPSENNSVFSSATLLNSLRYQGSTPATYQFVKEKDWKDGYHHKNVTYGFEISGSVEFEDEQLWYFDEGYVSNTTSEATESGNFSTYLPYVAHSPAKDGNGTYTLENGYHELEVNVKPTNLLRGCGTYGDPYVLDSEKLLKSIAKYLEHPEKTIDGWKICYPASETYHVDGSSDITLTFNSENQTWSEGFTIDQIRKHLSGAYYVIKNDMILVSFSGLGTEDYPFSGVIQGKAGQTKKITMSGTSQALIQYSNGSVVRNLTISLAQKAPLRSAAPEIIGSQRTANRAPKYFFGGVIGCVLGGDNIIDNVTVSTPEGKTPYNFQEGYTAFEHLVPIGGYVGVIAGGGVVFRGNISSNTGITGNNNQLYRNPIVGRVLGGYAFYEGNGTAPDNTDKNYKINTITSGAHLSLSGETLTIKDSEGLLLLSAIVSSGAGSYGKSLAYKTDYGVARVAKYDQIGANPEPSDYTLANNKDIPYLVYREGIEIKICPEDPQNLGQTGITLRLGEGPFDMSGYGNGYRGLSARYVSNAGFTAASTLSPYTVVMRLKSFDGNNKTVSGIRMDIREYDDDDFHAASMGGIFNIVWTNKNTGGTGNSVLAQNLILSNCTVKLRYIDNNGNDARQAQTAYFTQTDGISTVAVGGFIGTVNNLGPTNTESNNYLFTNIRLEADEGKRSTIYGPNGAGAIIGATGMKTAGFPGKLLTNGETVRFGPSFLNCSFSNTDVTGYMAAGGMVGCVAVNSPDFYSFGASQTDIGACYATCTITNASLTFASNSTVTTKAAGGICGGVFGGIGMRGLINDPKVGNLTGLEIIGEKQTVNTLKFDDVDILADVAFNDYIYTDTSNTKNGVDRGDTIAAAGCIGRISHPNDVRIYDVQIGSNEQVPEHCTIQATQTDTTKKVGARYAGGLIAYGYTNKDMTIADCSVYNTDILGATAGGFVALARPSTLNVSHSILQDCEVGCTSKAGGITGYSDAPVNLFNILIKDTLITKSERNASVARLVVQTASKTIKAAGISVFAKDGTVLPPDSDISGAYTGYVAYADYLAEQAETPIGSKAPYVTVNPSYSLTLADSPTELLTGDAVKDSVSYGSIGGQIWAENSNKAPATKGNYASYPKAKDIAKPTISTFHKELGEGPEDLPVLVVKGGDAKAITDYLDIITNGGYTAASKSTVDKVTFATTVYYLNQEGTAFSTVNWGPEHTGDPSVTTADEGKRLVVSGTSYDNSRHRFTLVEATFTTDLGDYTVSIPVVVLRKLEYVYMTTFSYGTEFHKQTYPDIRTHLLESTGFPFSAYLTFRYNQAYNANAATKLEYAEYDWKSYIEGGGNLIGMDKTLNFSVTLPQDTQLTLVDCQHGNQAYYYTVKNGGEKDIRLSYFRKDPEDVNTAFPFSMADVLGVTCSEKSLKTGAFTKLTDSTEATLLVNGEYFRPAKEGDVEGDRYDLIFPDGFSTAVPEENYYLIITVPKQLLDNGQLDPTFNLNGSLEVSDTNYLIPTNGTLVHRYGDHSESTHGSDETTYQISSGYQQSPKAITTHTAPVDLNDVNNAMHIELEDTITFSNAQAYSTTDLLFLNFTASLKQKGTDESGKATEVDYGFPAGTSGTVKFYIQDSAGNYYVPNENGWVTQSTEPDGTSSGYPTYDWVSDGGNLSLPLSADGTIPIDLSVVRNMIKGTQDQDVSKIIVTAKMENVAVPPGEVDDPIPSSENGTDTWTQIHYLAQLSTQARSLNYSTVRAVADDNTHYYRKAVNKVILSMDAAKIRQLGVNPLAPVGEDLVNGRSRIDLTAALDMTGLKDREQVLKNTDHIVFTLSLERRNDGVSGTDLTYETVAEKEKFISFQWKNDPEATDWTFTVSKDASGQFDQGFNEELYLFPLTAYVAMDRTQYSNYKIAMDVKFVDDKGIDTLNPNESIDTNDAYVVYTYACIKPSFYEPTP